MAENLHGSSSLALAGLFLSTVGIILQPELPLTISKENPEYTISLLVVITLRSVLALLAFYLNMLWLLLHVAIKHAGAPQASVLAFLLRVLRRAAPTASLVTLILKSVPLSVQMLLVEESFGTPINACLVCIASVMVSVFISKKLLTVGEYSQPIARGFAPALFALCTSIGFLVFIDLFDDASNDPSSYIPNNFLSFFLLPVLFMLGMSSLIQSMISAPSADEQQTAIFTKRFSTAVLTGAFATLLVGGYVAVNTSFI